MPSTKHHIIRLTDDRWAKLAETFRQVVPDEARPKNAAIGSNWQITTGFAMIADGKIDVCAKSAE